MKISKQKPRQSMLVSHSASDVRSRHRSHISGAADSNASNRCDESRQGSVITMSAAVLVMILAFTSFTVDFGWIALTRAQMSNACDAGAFAGASELAFGTGVAPDLTAAEVQAASKDAARVVAAENAAGDLDSTYVDMAQDIRLGQLQWIPAEQRWTEVWGATPYTMIEVAVHRDRGTALDINGKPLDGPLPLFFAPVIGHMDAGLKVTTAAAIMPGGGFRITSTGSAHCPLLPIALDEPTWDNLIAGQGDDDYGYNAVTGQVTNNSDGVLEVNIYPNGSSALPPGNRGTVDIGSPSNSTNDLKRQIREGVNAADLAWFGGEIRFDGTPLELNGDTGISAGIKSALEDVLGEVRAIPLFTSVSGPGNNATYVISRFVGVRLLDVKLTGNPNKRHLTVQPAPFSHSTVVKGETVIQTDSIFTKPVLIR